MIGPGSNLAHGQLRLYEPTDTTLENSGVYQKISGTFIDGSAFSFAIINNKLKYLGPSRCFLFNGCSDLEVDKSCEIIYGLYVNGVLVPEAQTPHDFPSPAKTTTISITALVDLNQNDELEVYAKSDNNNTVLSVKSLNITFLSQYISFYL